MYQNGARFEKVIRKLIWCSFLPPHGIPNGNRTVQEVIPAGRVAGIPVLVPVASPYTITIMPIR